MKSMYTFTLCLLLCFKGFSQYTETINSNRPGSSQGAFAVGKNVLQFEMGGKISQLSHKNLKNSTINESQLNYTIRYGFFKNKLELIINGAYNQNKSINKLINEDEIERKFLNKQTLGFKYLVFDPFKNKKWHSVSLLSWKKNRNIRLVDFIPAISVYAGVNYIPKQGYSYNDPFTEIKKNADFSIFKNPKWKISENTISPKASIITQNHFIGKWVLINNITLDRIGDKYPILNHTTTLTHNFKNPKWSSFFEFEMIKNDIYADNYYKFGLAFLLNRSYQFDIGVGTNIKDTPRNLFFKMGMSTRLDWYSDEIPIDKEELKKQKKKNKKLKKDAKDLRKSDKNKKKSDRKEKKAIKKANRKK